MNLNKQSSLSLTSAVGVAFAVALISLSSLLLLCALSIEAHDVSIKAPPSKAFTKLRIWIKRAKVIMDCFFKSLLLGIVNLVLFADFYL